MSTKVDAAGLLLKYSWRRHDAKLGSSKITILPI
jgi:hypothetical protein